MLAGVSEQNFPIDALLPDILASLAAHPRLVLEAPPGAGKTTRVPLALLDQDWLQGRRIVMLEPRRVAARAAAGYMAQQLGEAVGETVGYRIRFDSRVSSRTRVEVVTEGILTRMLQDDPALDGIGALLFDEFHERHLAGDLGLALALDVQASLRPNLRLVLMSATLEGERLAQWLDAPRLSSAGRSHPVEVVHVDARRDESLEAQARRTVEHALATHPGDVLVFLPGQREITRIERALAASPGLEGAVVLPLHGELAVERQAQALRPDPQARRRVVLATNVAESSVTLPGVRVVVDSGLAREPRYDPNSGFSRLETVRIAQSSAEQRAGRAGRVAAGWAYRLWPRSLRLEPQRRAEILQAELTGLALELAAWGEAALRFVDPPPPGALAAAQTLLQRLGAIDATLALTPLGRRMQATGAHPRLAAMLAAAGEDPARALACDLVALLEARDPLRSGSNALAERWRALAAFRTGALPPAASRAGFAAIDAAARQWRHRLRIERTPSVDVAAHALGAMLAHAFPDRIAYRHAHDRLRYQLANGRMARLSDDSALLGEPWLVAHALRFETGDARVLGGVPLDEASLHRHFGTRFDERDETRWDGVRRALVSVRVRRFDEIVLDMHPAGRVDPAAAAQALTDAVRTIGLAVLPWSEGLRQWRARVQSLRAWMPELGLPDLSDAALLATLEGWLSPAFFDKTRLDALSPGELSAAIQALLVRDALHRVERHAPARIEVPSGMVRPIEYAVDAAGAPEPPVLAVKLQELFGLADTPRIADGRVPLLLHLLSPAGRPLQVTRDLRSFWERTWPEVRKEMKGRYPKHPWPEDPWNAVATHRAKPRRS
jgi:ATP-dependent helicase HrpB